MKCEAWAVVCDICNRLGPLAVDLRRAEDEAVERGWICEAGCWHCSFDCWQTRRQRDLKEEGTGS